MKDLLTTTNLQVSIGNVQVCQQLNWHVEPGQTWGIMGLNGIGKTTLLNTLGGLHPQTSGEVLLEDKALSAYRQRERASQVGYLFQQPVHDFPQTIFEYCAASLHPHLPRWQQPSADDLQRVNVALEKTGLTELADRPLASLSGGERRRVEIAGLLVQNPRLWLLDEPFNHLDLHQQIRMMQLLVEQARQRDGAIIAVMHDANLAYRFCDHVLMLTGGGNFLIGTTAELFTPDTLSQLFQHRILAVADANTDAGRKVFIPE